VLFFIVAVGIEHGQCAWFAGRSVASPEGTWRVAEMRGVLHGSWADYFFETRLVGRIGNGWRCRRAEWKRLLGKSSVLKLLQIACELWNCCCYLDGELDNLCFTVRLLSLPDAMFGHSR
jgi:hypothetical protein